MVSSIEAVLALASCAGVRAMQVPQQPAHGRRGVALEALSRRHAVTLVPALLASSWQQAASAAEKTGSGLEYTVVKSGSGGRPITGDLIAIRFKGKVQATGAVFDDIMSGEPYYTRVGSGNVLPGVEEAVKLMRSGDTWNLTLPPELGFGPKGRPASPGKPRIPNGATLDFMLELVAVPGKDEELIEVAGDEQ